MFYLHAMNTSVTPILDLETPPPRRRDGVSLQGLLRAVPAAFAVVAIVPLVVLIRVVAERYVPYWTDFVFSSPPLLRIVNPLSRMELVPGLLTIWTGIWIVTAIHETGHAVAALLGGWDLLEIRALPFTLQKRSDKWQLRMCWKIWPAAGVFAEPKTTRFHSSLRAYALAGPSANLLTFIVFTLPFILFDSSQIPAVFDVIYVWSLVGAISNLLPFHISDMEMDGYTAFIVSSTPKLTAARIASIKIRNHVLAGKPVEKVNQRWIALAEGVGTATLQNVAGLWLAYSYWLQKDEYERAAHTLERVLRAGGNYSDEGTGIL
jgi:hypothetical protein